MHILRDHTLGADRQGCAGRRVSPWGVRVPGLASPRGKCLLFGVGLLVLRTLLVGEIVWAQAEVSFIGRQDFGVGAFPASVAVGDFNGDGHLDLATASGIWSCTRENRVMARQVRICHTGGDYAPGTGVVNATAARGAPHGGCSGGGQTALA